MGPWNASESLEPLSGSLGPVTPFDVPVVRYPDDRVESLDDRFNKYKLGTAALEMLWTGGRWLEGPVWFGDGRYLLFSDIPNNRILKWEEETGNVSVWRKPSNNTNGNTRDRQGRLISCEHDARRVTRTEHDGSITVLIDRFDDKPLNAPNDVVVKTDGSIWFTDPGYGILMNYEGHRAEFELDTNVYRLDPDTGEATVVAADFRRPNGLCFSPDESLLYIVDTGGLDGTGYPSQIQVFDVDGGTRLANGRLFAEISTDGIRTDLDGNIWASAGWRGEGYDGVHCYDPDGTLIGKIHLPSTCANVCFGGAKKNRLFMTTSQSLFSLYVETTGAQKP